MYTLRKSTTVAVGIALALVLTMGVLAMFKAKADPTGPPPLEAGAPSEEGVQPEVITLPDPIKAKNPECADLGNNYLPVLHDDSLKFAPTEVGTPKTSTDGYLTVTVDRVYGPETFNGYTGQFFDWHSNRPVDLVIAKGADGGDSYAYDLTTEPGPITKDGHLHAPVNASGSYANLSHMDFCYKYRPDVTKTANPTFTRTYKWKVDKKVNSVNPNPLTLRTTGLAGATGTANYTVSVNKADPAYVDSGWAVSGDITVTNPLTSGSMVITELKDVVSRENKDDIHLTPTDCNPALPSPDLPVTLGPGDSLTCKYSTPLDSGTAGHNTATAVVSPSDTIPLANGVNPPDSAKFEFVNPTTEVDKNVKVTDSYSGGPQNQSVSVGDVSSAPKTYTYNRTIGSYDTCGDQKVENTATLYGDNNAVLGTASTSLTAHVLCNAKIIKTVRGSAPSGSQSFTFELRQGASTTAPGAIKETQVANAGNGGVINFATGLEPGSTYQICEWVMPGWNTNLNEPLFVPESMTTPTLPNPNVNNMIVCTNFTVGAGQTTRTFNVDNSPPPGGRALTIGFWKNWASCASSAGKGQKPMLDLALGTASSSTITTNPPGGLVVSAQNPGSGWPNYATAWYLVLKGNSTSTAPDCSKAVNLLNKTTIDGKTKKASDPLFNMTAQLVAAQLNRFMGAGISGQTIMNIDKAVLLNGKYKFYGSSTNPYTGTLTAADTNLANCLATQLDNYNNDRPVSNCP